MVFEDLTNPDTSEATGISNIKAIFGSSTAFAAAAATIL